MRKCFLANKKTFRRYSRTNVRDKRSLVRSLNSFTKQYKYAFIEKVRLNEKKEIEFGKLMGLSFSQESKKVLGEIKYESGMIYSANVALNDLSSYQLIFNAIDNLVSINTKSAYKEALKAILKRYTENNISTMLDENNEDIVIQDISDSFECSITYAKRIYQQLKNRIRFAYVGLYSVNNVITNKVNVLIPNFITPYDELKSKIHYILKREWFFTDSVLNELRLRVEKLKEPKKIFFEEHYEDLIQQIEGYFAIHIYDTEDDIYYDALEFLQYTYLKEMYENAPYSNPNYTPYEYEFITDYATDNFKNTDSAKSYIQYYNQDVLEIESMNDAEDTFNEEQAIEQFNQMYNAPIDAEIYYDSTIEDKYRDSASSTTLQWSNFYDTLLSGIISKDENKNVYKKVCEFSSKILSEYLLLEKSGMYLENGLINESCDVFKNIRIELEEELTEVEGDDKYRRIREVVAMKKKECRLLYKTVNENSIFYALEDFNYKTLRFRELEIS